MYKLLNNGDSLQDMRSYATLNHRLYAKNYGTITDTEFTFLLIFPNKVKH